ncbi:MAG: hypothetical protein MR704_16090 [Clostridia bacterium]|nr:hypothetical protein [Clostridia bacterium]
MKEILETRLFLVYSLPFQSQAAPKLSGLVPQPFNADRFQVLNIKHPAPSSGKARPQ